MTAETAPETGSTFRVLPALLMAVGAVLMGLGLLFLPNSLYGGIHIAAIGASLFLSGMISTRWAANRWNMSPTDQRQWSLRFALLAGILLILFIIINYASFEGPFVEEGST